jgi:hypothetical protein
MIYYNTSNVYCPQSIWFSLLIDPIIQIHYHYHHICEMDHINMISDGTVYTHTCAHSHPIVILNRLRSSHPSIQSSMLGVSPRTFHYTMIDEEAR